MYRYSAFIGHIKGHFRALLPFFINSFRLRHSADQVVHLFHVTEDFFSSKQSFPCLFRGSHIVLPCQPHFPFPSLGVSWGFGHKICNSTLPSSSSSSILLPLHGCSAEFLTYQTGQTASDGHSMDLMKGKRG